MALANAGIERVPPTSAAMSLSATAVIQAAPHAISIVTSATLATVHDALLSTEEEGVCNIEEKPGLAIPLLHTAHYLTTYVCGELG
jgi:hypothetical protein